MGDLMDKNNLNLYNYNEIINMKTCSSNEENTKLLKSFISTDINEYYISAWDNILSCINIEIIDDELFSFLLENNICIEKLCCMNLSNKRLIDIYNKYNCVEALITIGRRMFFENKYSGNELIEFVSLYKEIGLLDHLIKCIPAHLCNNKNDKTFIDKSKLLLEYVTLNINDDYLNSCTYENQRFIDVLLETNIIKLRNYYLSKDDLVILALSLNDNTPIDILNDIIKLNNKKYIKISRKNSIINISNRKN